MNSRIFSATLFCSLLAAVSQVSSADVPETVSIPLHSFKVPAGKSGVQYKLGIPVSLGGGPFMLYEFDTGASGFYAAYNRSWWRAHETLQIPFSITYASKINYQGIVATTSVDLGHGIPPVTTNVGLIQNGSGGSIDNWNSDVEQGIPPLYEHFFGDFGSALHASGGYTPPSGSSMQPTVSTGLFAILPQLPDNLSSGFVVSTGGEGAPHPVLTIGLTRDIRAQFRCRVPMLPVGGTGTFPNPAGNTEGRTTYQSALINANFSLQSQTASTSVLTGVVLDTGAPSMEIHSISPGFPIPESFIAGSRIISGVLLKLIAAGVKDSPLWSLIFETGTTTGFTWAGYTKNNGGLKSSKAYINAGLNAFFRFDVMFDVENGVVGFRRILAAHRPLLHVSARKTIETAKETIIIRGNAFPRNQLVAEVRYKVGYHGSYRKAVGVTPWHAEIPLSPGRNVIVFRAQDVAGVVSAPVSLVVIRKED